MKRTALAALVLLLPVSVLADEGLATRLLLVAGHPPAETSMRLSEVAVVPGVVLALDGSERSWSVVDAADVAELASRLRDAVALEHTEAVSSPPRRLAVGEEMVVELPTSEPTLAARVTLTALGEEATYRVRFAEGDEVLSDNLVTVPRDRRALVGGLGRQSAPYLFLVVAPAWVGGGEAPRLVGEGMTPPRILERPTTPQYTPEARAQRIQGVVILQATIDLAGRVRDVEVLKGLPLGLGEAAVEAVRDWTFVPALDEQGRPVEVHYNLTVSFRLDDPPARDEVPAALRAP
jgi:TonB family protein